MATHSSVLAWRIPGRGSLVGCRLWGRTESDMTEVTQQQQQALLPRFSDIRQPEPSHIVFSLTARQIGRVVFLPQEEDTELGSIWSPSVQSQYGASHRCHCTFASNCI